MTLHISPGINLPLELAAQSIGDYGQRGTGKTYTAGVLVEDMLEAGLQVVVIDPTDVWWGLRSSADGKRDGYRVYVFGGTHADVPLEEGAGELIADVLVDSGISAVLSLRHLRKGAQHNFFRAFAERFYHRKGEPDKRTPVHVVIDEAHSFAPSTVTGDTARMVGAVEDLVRLGRSAGIGVSLISQRPKSVNANVRTQAEALVCHRLMDPLDRKAVLEWVSANDDAGRRDEFVRSLGSLKNGEAWVWSPPLDLFERIQVRKKRTFDSSVTPKIGEVRIEPKQLTAVDVEALGMRIAETVERKKADDPKTLRARIAELERASRAKQAPVVDTAVIARLTAERDAAVAEANRRGVLLRRANETIERIGQQVETFQAVNAADADATMPAVVSENLAARTPVAEPRTAIAARPRVHSDVSLAKAERAVLSVLAQRPSGLQMGPLAMLAGYRVSGGFRNTLSALRTAGHLEGGNGEVMRATAEGLAALGDYDELPTGRALLDYWLADSRIGKAAKAVLQIAYDRHPDSLNVDTAAEATGYQPSGGFRNALSELRTAGLIDGGNQAFRAAEEFFE